jgi:hypothetical protein
VRDLGWVGAFGGGVAPEESQESVLHVPPQGCMSGLLKTSSVAVDLDPAVKRRYFGAHPHSLVLDHLSTISAHHRFKATCLQ